MKAADLREKSTDDLSEMRASLSKDLFSYRMKNSVGQLEDTSLMGKVRKDIARIEQILTERRAAEEASDSAASSAAQGGAA